MLTSILNLAFGNVVDVCVVGGGSSGTYLGYQAAKMNYSVAIFEPNGYLGGHCEDYTVQNAPGQQPPINIGVQFLQNDRTHLIASVYSELNVSFFPAPVPVPGFLDFSTGKVETKINPTNLVAEVQRYSKYVLDKYSFIDSKLEVPDFLSPEIDTEELLMPFSEFITKHNFEALRFDLNRIVSSSGQDPERTLTFFALTYANPRILPFLIPEITAKDVGLEEPLYYFPIMGCSAVYSRMAEFIKGNKGNIFLKAEVQNIARFENSHYDGANNELTFNHEGSSNTIRCRSTTIAYPQIVSEMEKMMSLAKEEKELFAKANHYSSVYVGIWRSQGLFMVPGLGIQTFSNVRSSNGSLALPQFPFQAYLGPYGVDNLGRTYLVPYYMYDGPSQLPIEFVKNATREDYRSLEPTLGDIYKNPVLFDEDPIIFKEHKLYLRAANSSDIRDGIYNKLFGLQGGIGAIYYTGTLFSQANQLAVWQYSDEVLKQIVSKLQ